MFRYIYESIDNKPSRNLYRQVIGGGILLFLLGLVILLVPEILIAFIASIFFLLGTTVAVIGWQLRRSYKDAQGIRIKIY